MYTDLLAMLRHLDLTELKESHMENVDAESFSALSDGTAFSHQHLETLSVSYGCPYDVIFGHRELPWENLRAFSVINGGCHWSRLAMSMRRLTSFEYKIKSSIGIFESSCKPILALKSSSSTQL